MVHQGLGHSIPCSFIVMSSQDTSRVTHEPISTGFREAIQGNTRQYKAIRSEREIMNVDGGMVASARRLRRAYRAIAAGPDVCHSPSVLRGALPFVARGGVESYCLEYLGSVHTCPTYMWAVTCHPNVDSRVHISTS